MGRTVLCLLNCVQVPVFTVPGAKGAQVPGDSGTATSLKEPTLCCASEAGGPSSAYRPPEGRPRAARLPASTHVRVTHFGLSLWKNTSLPHLSLAPPMPGCLEAPERVRGASVKGITWKRGSAGRRPGKSRAGVGHCAHVPDAAAGAPSLRACGAGLPVPVVSRQAP